MNSTRIDFEYQNRACILVKPENPAKGNPWVWRAEFFGAFDTADRELLSRGWHIAYICLSDMYGCPDAVAEMHNFYLYLTSEYRLSPFPSIFGFSRGGLYTCNYLLAHPDCASSIYLDAPVMSIHNWPGGATPSQKHWKECLECYHLTEESAKDFRNNPLDNVQKMANANVPVILVAGLKDKLVNYNDNGGLFKERFINCGGVIKTILKPECDHHPHSLDDASPIADFIEAAFESKKH